MLGLSLLATRSSSVPRVLAQQPAPDPALLRELAERALSPPYSGPVGEPQTVQLLPGAVPDDLPFALPRPPGSRLLGSVVRTSFGPGPGGPMRGENVEIILDAPGAPSEIVSAFEGALAEQGWSVPDLGGPGRPGGFVPTAVAASLTLCRSDRGPWLTLNVFPRPPGPNDVRLRLETSFPGPCGGIPPRPPSPIESDLLPTLEPPAGVNLQVVGGGGAPFFRASDAVVETELSVAELEAHYARQLAAAGWQRQSDGGDDLVRWSRWALPGEGERVGFFVVTAGPGPNRRTLHVQAVTPVGEGPPGPVPGVVAVPVGR
jgi:hypothetical protein